MGWQWWKSNIVPHFADGQHVKIWNSHGYVLLIVIGPFLDGTCLSLAVQTFLKKTQVGRQKQIRRHSRSYLALFNHKIHYSLLRALINRKRQMRPRGRRFIHFTELYQNRWSSGHVGKVKTNVNVYHHCAAHCAHNLSNTEQGRWTGTGHRAIDDIPNYPADVHACRASHLLT